MIFKTFCNKYSSELSNEKYPKCNKLQDFDSNFVLDLKGTLSTWLSYQILEFSTSGNMYYLHLAIHTGSEIFLYWHQYSS